MKKLPRVTVICQACGRGFEVSTSQAAKGEKKFCSLRCRYDSQKGKPVQKIPYDIPEDWLIEQYVSLKRSATEIAAEYGCSHGVILSRLHLMGVEIRPATDKAHEATRVIFSEGKHPFQSTENRQATCARNKSLRGRIKNSVSKRGKKHHRVTGETSKHPRGEDWFWRRKMVRMRDKGICQVCGKKPEQGKRPFDVHHIAAWQLFVGKDKTYLNCMGNLVTLCPTCHRKAEEMQASDPRLTTDLNFAQSALMPEWREAFPSITFRWLKTKAT